MVMESAVMSSRKMELNLAVMDAMLTPPSDVSFVNHVVSLSKQDWASVEVAVDEVAHRIACLKGAKDSDEIDDMLKSSGIVTRLSHHLHSSLLPIAVDDGQTFAQSVRYNAEVATRIAAEALCSCVEMGGLPAVTELEHVDDGAFVKSLASLLRTADAELLPSADTTEYITRIAGIIVLRAPSGGRPVEEGEEELTNPIVDLLRGLIELGYQLVHHPRIGSSDDWRSSLRTLMESLAIIARSHIEHRRPIMHKGKALIVSIIEKFSSDDALQAAVHAVSEWASNPFGRPRIIDDFLRSRNEEGRSPYAHVAGVAGGGARMGAQSPCYTLYDQQRLQHLFATDEDYEGEEETPTTFTFNQTTTVDDWRTSSAELLVFAKSSAMRDGIEEMQRMTCAALNAGRRLIFVVGVDAVSLKMTGVCTGSSLGGEGEEEMWPIDEFGQHIDAMATHHLQPMIMPSRYSLTVHRLRHARGVPMTEQAVLVLRVTPPSSHIMYQLPSGMIYVLMGERAVEVTLGEAIAYALEIGQ